jgi:two-component system, NarL family, invasion response regulator UvrY
MIRIVLVDDHAMVRMGFRMLLSGAADLAVVGEFETAEALLAEVARLAPDVVVMDLSMPGMGGLEAVRRLVAHDAKARILVLSAHEDSAHPQRAMRAGALGYLAKRSAPETLITAIRAVAAHEAYVDAQTARTLAMAQVKGERHPTEALSEREFAVFIQLARGKTVAQIADQLKLAPSTVGTHLYHVKQKLGAGNQSELTLVALRWGLLSM